MTLEAFGLALLIFALRIFNNAIGTVRVVMITRDMRFWSSVLGFIEALTFVVVIAGVAKDLSNIPSLMAYCGGYAVGGYVGMAIEARFIISYVEATVVSTTCGHEIAVALRERGYGVTEAHGTGRDGEVMILRSVIQRRDSANFSSIVQTIHPQAFVSMVEARAIEHGWLRQMR